MGKISKKKHNENHPEYSKYLERECEICGTKNLFEVGDYTVRRKILTIHHKDGNVENNNKNNLQTLCRQCHKKIHYENTWKTII